jgi:hypothetical protein
MKVREGRERKPIVSIHSRHMRLSPTHKRQLEIRAETALLAGSLGPGEVGELGVGRDANDLGVDSGELGEGGVEGEDLSGADDCAKRS